MSSAEPAIDESPFASVVVGGGPGGMGPLLWAAQHGLLDAWLEQGVALVERSGRLGGTLGRYGICSDSLGGSYLECLEARSAGALLPSLARAADDDRDATPIVRASRRCPWSIATWARSARRWQRRSPHPASALHLHTTVQSVHLRGDGTVAVFARARRPAQTLVARSAIIALGGRQPWQDKATSIRACASRQRRATCCRRMCC